jgi:hypothetical protein
MGRVRPLDAVPDLVGASRKESSAGEVNGHAPAPSVQPFETNDAAAGREKRSGRQRHETKQAAAEIETTQQARVQTPAADVVRDRREVEHAAGIPSAQLQPQRTVNPDDRPTLAHSLGAVAHRRQGTAHGHHDA